MKKKNASDSAYHQRTSNAVPNETETDEKAADAREHDEDENEHPAIDYMTPEKKRELIERELIKLGWTEDEIDRVCLGLPIEFTPELALKVRKLMDCRSRLSGLSVEIGDHLSPELVGILGIELSIGVNVLKRKPN
jgi:hypothetical protein